MASRLNCPRRARAQRAHCASSPGVQCNVATRQSLKPTRPERGNNKTAQRQRPGEGNQCRHSSPERAAHAGDGIDVVLAILGRRHVGCSDGERNPFRGRPADGIRLGARGMAPQCLNLDVVVTRCVSEGTLDLALAYASGYDSELSLASIIEEPWGAGHSSSMFEFGCGGNPMRNRGNSRFGPRLRVGLRFGTQPGLNH